MRMRVDEAGEDMCSTEIDAFCRIPRGEQFFAVAHGADTTVAYGEGLRCRECGIHCMHDCVMVELVAVLLFGTGVHDEYHREKNNSVTHVRPD